MSTATYAPGVAFHPQTANRKLAPVELEGYAGAGSAFKSLRPVPAGPYVSATYVSIGRTCPSSCAFRSGGCYVMRGFTGRAARLLDERSEGLAGDEVIAAEVDVIDGAFRGEVPQDGGRDGTRGRDLRLHIGGDTSSEAGVETPEAARRAIKRGYVPAIVLPEFPADTRRPFDLAGVPGWRALACPAETRGTTCVQCRACFSSGPLREEKIAIAFAAHGGDGGAQARRALTVLS